MDQNFKEPQYGFTPPPPQPHMPPKTNGKSIAALVLGILSIMLPYIGFIIGIIAIVFSAISLKEIKNQEQGRGMAIAGLVCGIVGTAIYAIIILVFILAALLYWNSGYSDFNNNYSFG